MNQQQYIINRKANIVELGKMLGNISEACRRLGVSRQHYYDIKKTIEEEGIEGLVEESRRAKKTRYKIQGEMEQRILDYCLQYPTQVTGLEFCYFCQSARSH